MLKRICYLMLIIFMFCLCATLLGEESMKDFFPVTHGSTWVYVDQDGNEMTLSTIEGEEIADKIYHGFSQEPEIKDWINFNRFMLPTLCHIGEENIQFLVGDEVEKAVKARFNREFTLLSKLAKNAIENELPDEVNASVKLNYDVEVESDDHFNLLMVKAAPEEEWDTIQIKAKVEMEYDIKGIPDFPNAEEIPTFTFNFTINESGKILGMETVKTAAGTFEDCLKIEYRTETEMKSNAPAGDPEESPGESITTLWLAPNVGIVKFHQESKMIFMSMLSERDLVQTSPSEQEVTEITKPKVRTFELKKYEIKTGDKGSKEIISKNETETENEQPKNAAKSHNYFPNTLDSFWVYEDQDGTELKRIAIEGEEIAGEIYPAFSYEPELEDWVKYNCFMYPSLYNISDEGIKLVVGEEIKKSVKTRLKKEIDLAFGKLLETAPEGASIDSEIDVKGQDKFLLLPNETVGNEDWDSNKVEAKIKLTFSEAGIPEPHSMTFNFTIIETGIVVGKETVKVPAGTYENCLKVQYITDTTLSTIPEEIVDDTDPAGETVTTLWFAENVGIVKFHQKRKHTFIEIIPDDDLPFAPEDPKDITFELKKFAINTGDKGSDEIKSENENKVENEQPRNEQTVKDAAKSHNYFPNTLDSFWVYEDQDGTELKRIAIEGEEIAGEIYPAFSYEPELENFTKFISFMHPSLYNISDKGIKLVVSEELKKFVKASLKNEMDFLIDKNRELMTENEKIDFDIEVQTQDNLLLLSNTTVINEEWDVNEVEAKIKLTVSDKDQQRPQEEITFNFTIIESGNVIGKETVIVSAGTFQECLKVVYKTETSFSMMPDDDSDETDPPGETVTTLWFAPNVGIVKFHQKRKYTFLEIIPDDAGFPMPPDPKDITLELKKYEIKTTEPVIDEQGK